MTRYESYCALLREKPASEWEGYLLEYSGLPGPRGNLELAQAAADCGTSLQFQRWMAFNPQIAPTNTPGEFLAFCGAIGLGRLLAEGETFWLYPLRKLASDPRWRLREAVAMALQRLGKTDMTRLLAVGLKWANGGLLECRAAAAAVCEPALLNDPAYAIPVLEILDRATGVLANTAQEERSCDDFQALRKGLGYCWSVAVAVYPEGGKPAFERWLDTPDRDVRWVLRENLKKNRVIRRDPKWVQACLERLLRQSGL
jgi:hypothetical protein